MWAPADQQTWRPLQGRISAVYLDKTKENICFLRLIIPFWAYPLSKSCFLCHRPSHTKQVTSIAFFCSCNFSSKSSMGIAPMTCVMAWWRPWRPKPIAKCSVAGISAMELGEKTWMAHRHTAWRWNTCKGDEDRKSAIPSGTLDLGKPLGIQHLGQLSTNRARPKHNQLSGNKNPNLTSGSATQLFTKAFRLIAIPRGPSKHINRICSATAKACAHWLDSLNLLSTKPQKIGSLWLQGQNVEDGNAADL